MKIKKLCCTVLVGLILTAGISLFGKMSVDSTSSLSQLLPEIKNWAQSEESQAYYPETLFEYINGAAESYLSYEFKELIVAQYKQANSESNIAIEIYDMGSTKNAFGIYSAERYPENRFIEIGLQGYSEEGTLNFMSGHYYIKILCFDCGSQSESFLLNFAEKIGERIGEKGNWPVPISALPAEKRIDNTEKYILQNFLGYGFLHDGYSASYLHEDMEFDCFIIAGNSEEEAKAMLDRFLEAKGKENVDYAAGLYWVRDKYYHNIYLSLTDQYICGVMKIQDNYKELGREYLDRLTAAVGSMKK